MLIDDDCLDIEIPNMLLQPLVENAVQHGSQLESNHNPVSLEISRTQSTINIVLVNKAATHSDSGYGIGLKNTRERLERLFSDFKLELSELNDDLFRTTLILPIGGRHA